MASESPYTRDHIIMAPLSGYTDVAFRAACRRCGCYYAFTPLLDAGSLLHGNPRNASILHRDPGEPWLGVQLLGSAPERLAQAALILNDCPFDLLDLNLGCPVPKVTKRGAGAALGCDVDLAARCVTALVRHSVLPVTAKIRILSADDPAPTVRLGQALEAAGIVALTIHGRVWDQIYSGPVATEIIRAVDEVLAIPVVANGGVFKRDNADELLTRTGCNRLMVARGAIGNPWLFREIRDPDAPPPTHEEVCDQVEQHVRQMVDHYGEPLGMRNARKIILAYLTGRGYRRSRRNTVTGIATLAEFTELLGILRDEGPSPRFNPAHDGLGRRSIDAAGDAEQTRTPARGTGDGA